MGSTRLPGKSMMALVNDPLISWSVKRCMRYTHIKEMDAHVWVATSNLPKDNILCEYLHKEFPTLNIFRGSEHDVLSRYKQICSSHNYTYIFRVTGDCPLINYRFIDLCMERVKCSNPDIINYCNKHFYADKGLEMVRSDAILRLCKRNDLTSSDKEHVTRGIYSRPEQFKCEFLNGNCKISQNEWDFSIDNNDDLIKMNSLLSEYGGTADQIETDMFYKFTRER